jgi:two-component system, LytTR family, response regulator
MFTAFIEILPAVERNVAVHQSTKTVLFDPLSVIMIQSSSNYSTIYLDNGEKIFTSKTLKHWQKLLTGVAFLRVHTSYIVNVAKVKAKNKNKIILQNNVEVAIARRRLSEMKLYFKKSSIA